MKKGNEPAFPATPNDARTGEDCYFEGLTKLEYFAAKAMQSLIITDMQNGTSLHNSEIAEDAVKYADSLLKELAK